LQNQPLSRGVKDYFFFGAHPEYESLTVYNSRCFVYYVCGGGSESKVPPLDFVNMV
jgi:hypothetical protein